jgi:hypothetical protein
VPMESGTITLNGVTQTQANKLIKLKEKNEGHYSFEVALVEPSQRDPHGTPLYNGVILSWRSEPNLRFVLQVVESLLE